MLALRRKPEWLGNVVLLSFLAVLLGMWWSVPVGFAAETVTVQMRNPEVDNNVIVRFEIDIHPLTLPEEPTTVELIFTFGDQPSLSTPAVVYRAYDPVAQQVYGIVYLVYGIAIPTGFRFTPDLVSVQVYLVQSIPQRVYVAVATPPPEVPPPPPPAVPEPGAQEAAAGTLVVAQNRATYRVDPVRVSQLLAQVADRLVLYVPASVNVPSASFQVPSQVLQAVASAGKGLQVAVAALNAALELDARALEELARRVGTAPVTLSIARVEEDRAPARPAEPGFRTAGPVLEVRAEAPGAGTVPARVILPYDPARLGGLPEWKLGVYRYDEPSRAWRFVGGRVDVSRRQVAGFPPGLSLFTVMAYDVTFADLAGHWARMDVELMASQHVARGVAPGRFAPQGTLTRAQLAALAARALQLAPVRPQRPTFADLPASHWAFAEVEAAVAAGLVRGTGPGTFEPDRPVTREEAASILMRALRYLGATDPNRLPEALQMLNAYADRDQVARWAIRDLAEAVLYGLVKGRTPSRLEPQGLATRAEAVVIIKRLLQAAGRL